MVGCGLIHGFIEPTAETWRKVRDLANNIHFVYTIVMSSKKHPISLRVAPDILEWFKKQKSRGYQGLMHDVLEDYVNQKRGAQIRAAGRAQEIFRQYYTRCFWHYDPELIIDAANIDLVIQGLRKYGGRQGMILAKELCQ